MKLNAIIASALLGLLFITEANAQQRGDMANSGSFYSSLGFGVPADVRSPYSSGMGLTGVGNYTNMSANISNPAQWALASFSYGSISMGMTNYYARDNSASVRGSLLSVDHFQLLFPLLRDRLGVSLSFTPLTRSNYQVLTEGEFFPLSEFSSNQVEFGIETLGSGGINRFEVGAGYRLTSFLTVGYGFSANLLSKQEEVSSLFSDNSFRAVNTSRSIEGNSIGHRFGIFAYRNSLFGNNDQISFGATVSLPIDITSERSISAFRTVNGSRQLIELNENSPDRMGNVRLPLEFNTGLTYNLSRFVNVSSELMFQEWSDASYSYSSTQQAYFKDRTKVGLGFQYHPYRVEQASGFFTNMRYSVGTSYDNGHLSIQGQDIETMTFNAGVGIISRGTSTLDLNFHYGIRGTQSSNLVKENIWGFSLSLNLAEFMFVRQRFQ